MHSPHMFLRAGPIRLKFADGELRYLCVGDHEIARRLLFVVRDHHWDTAMPRFTKVDVQRMDDSFRIELEARCVIPTVDYAWTAVVTGSANGVITFAASGEPMRDFGSNRIGVCLLFGAESLAGIPFDVVNSSGETQPGEFPNLVSPELLGKNFSHIRYQMGSGLRVSASAEGALFSMEDQRNYADTSYKAYAPLPYAYPAAPAGLRLEQAVTLKVTCRKSVPAPKPRFSPVPETVIRIGRLVEGAKVPKVSRSAKGAREVDFYTINTRRRLHQDAEIIQFACNPALHLPDDDTLMENIAAILDQVRTVRSFASGAKIRIDPVTFNSQHPRPEPDLRNATAFGAVWSAAVLKYMSLARVDEAAFAVNGEAARAVQDEIGAYAGCDVLEAVSEAAVRPPLEMLAIAAKDSVRMWLINMTESPQRAIIVQKDERSILATFDLEPYSVVARELLPPLP